MRLVFSTKNWRPIASAPTKGRDKIWLKIPNREPQLAYSDTWWRGGFSAECKPTHWQLAQDTMPEMEGVR